MQRFDCCMLRYACPELNEEMHLFCRFLFLSSSLKKCFESFFSVLLVGCCCLHVDGFSVFVSCVFVGLYVFFLALVFFFRLHFYCSRFCLSLFLGLFPLSSVAIWIEHHVEGACFLTLHSFCRFSPHLFLPSRKRGWKEAE